MSQLGPLTESRFVRIVEDDLGLAPGDVVFVHSSLGKLVPNFSFLRVFSLLRQIVGKEGTLVFPTFPDRPSYEYLAAGSVFDVRTTPSSMGVLSELARRQPDAIRSLHPTKSVCAIGPLAEELVSSHHVSPYPYDHDSPFARVIEHGGKAIGLGVRTTNLSLLHCVDDALRADFPVEPYHTRRFHARCIDLEGYEIVVPVYAHDLSIRQGDIPAFMAKYVDPTVCQDLELDGRPFFRADTRQLFQALRQLAVRKITIYQRRFHGVRRTVAFS